jgi:hypothetical protein
MRSPFVNPQNGPKGRIWTDRKVEVKENIPQLPEKAKDK